MPDYRRAWHPGGTYFFTVNLLQRHGNDLLTRHHEVLRETVKSVRQRHPFVIHGWVVLPNHLHGVIELPSNDADFATRWRLIKMGFSKALPPTERRSPVRLTRGERGIWQQEKVTDLFISSETNRRQEMKPLVMAIIAAACVGLALDRGFAQSTSPREQLQQLVAQLQKTPDDNTLREKVIKLAQQLKPVPVVPLEAEKFEGRAEYAFRNAKTEADFAAAAKEYENAIAAAQWAASNYFNLGVAQEKAGKPADAKRSFEWYLKASPGAVDAKDVRKRIAGLEFGIEQANSPQAREDALWRKVEGMKFIVHMPNSGIGAWDQIFEIKDRMLSMTVRIFSSITPPSSIYGHDRPGEYLIERMHYRDGGFTFTYNDFTTVWTISSDGQLMQKMNFEDGTSEFQAVPRQ